MHRPRRDTVIKARDLRSRMSLPEVLVWSALRGRGLGGARFRRQHPVGPYVLDFYCEAARLAVEIDGDQHGDPAQSAHDARRDDWLNRQGIRVMRIPARDVLADLPAVLDHIARILPLGGGSVARP